MSLFFEVFTCLQACAFRDSYEKFKKAGAEVIGISGDDATSHKVLERCFVAWDYFIHLESEN